jgi:hypothetical protein
MNLPGSWLQGCPNISTSLPQTRSANGARLQLLQLLASEPVGQVYQVFFGETRCVVPSAPGRPNPPKPSSE